MFQICQVKEIKTWDALVGECGTGLGCEICKPAVASILASLWNDFILDKNDQLQDSNDKFLGNIQRGGTYSVVPRIAAGEITPVKLIVLGEVARKYGLYTKITGGQRVDLLGAKREQLPEIWEELVGMYICFYSNVLIPLLFIKTLSMDIFPNLPFRTRL